MEEKYRKILVEVIFLGLTPALAATINSISAISMGVGIIFIMVMSTLTMRLFRSFVTEENKYFVTLVVTTLFASIFQMVTEAYFLSAYKNIGIYIALCSVNMMLFAAANGAVKKEEKNIERKHIEDERNASGFVAVIKYCRLEETNITSTHIFWQNPNMWPVMDLTAPP